MVARGKSATGVFRENEKAARRAARLDRAWFAANPEAILRLRSSLPYEWPHWNRRGHEETPFVLVRQTIEGAHAKRAFYAKSKPSDDLPTLAALWDYIQEHVPAQVDGPIVPLSQRQHHELSHRVKVLREAQALAALGLTGRSF